jgi:hypothetical protein
MPLPPPVSRKQIHERQIDMRGYARDDGLFDIEGHVIDRKPETFTVHLGPTVTAGSSIHEMWVRLTIDDQFEVRDAAAVTDAGPYADCRDAPPSLQRIVGVRIGGGWTREVKARLGGVQSCTHLMELLIPMGTVAFQALYLTLRERPMPLDKAGRPVKIDSCYAFASNRDIVAIRWPEHYTGKARAG